ncbi:Thioredoxin-like protein 4A [Gracilariopsis chorda]|uniref:Thioredoxin-like protein 4A n=1 Tax=Gracilariopsis chorda TaxID=448386 RepID=A0A2V3IJE4_9FLOR|nr:Thioredoxin-like protein 4A [Gracilariopsis chorda]|eukprot:PXF42192.1 Thioredoxin-like protein 4A [Gracilariopsis chorda]
MSYLLPHLDSESAVNEALRKEEERVVVLRWGTDSDPTCMIMDETLYRVAELVKNFAVIYLVDITQVTAFSEAFKLTDACSVMFFHRDKHIMVDMGTGNNNKITFVITDKQDMIDIIEVVYRGARKGRGLVTAPKDYSTRAYN